MYNGYNKGYDFSTNKIIISYELSDEEIFRILVDEKCNFQIMLEHINPPLNYLLENKNKIKGYYLSSIIAERKDLSIDNKYILLPKSQHKFLLGNR